MAEVWVPLLDLGLQYATIRAEVDKAIQRVVESQHFVLGPEVRALEREIAGYCTCEEAVGCASGSDAILLALMALGIGAGDQVICPTYTLETRFQVGRRSRPRTWREAVAAAGTGWPASGGEAKESADGAEGANGDGSSS